jgi:hypothetical protein
MVTSPVRNQASSFIPRCSKVSVRESLFVSDAIALSQLITATATGSIWRETLASTPESEYSGEPYITELLSLNPDVQP